MDSLLLCVPDDQRKASPHDPAPPLVFISATEFASIAAVCRDAAMPNVGMAIASVFDGATVSAMGGLEEALGSFTSEDFAFGTPAIPVLPPHVDPVELSHASKIGRHDSAVDESRGQDVAESKSQAPEGAKTPDDGTGKMLGPPAPDQPTGDQYQDSFVFRGSSDSTPSHPDLITDYIHPPARIDLSLIDADTSRPGDQAFEFAGQSNAVVPHSVTWYQMNGNTIVQADVNGDSGADVVIIVPEARHHLTHSDFAL